LSNEEERVSMDLRKEEGKTVLRKLIQVSDVLVRKMLNEDSQH
jgi:crotonobetainyl-CoA:carnitine CoA-transferase CaiB-like acyl-CoA transferase